MGLLESEGDWLPGVRVSPPWPYLIRLPLLRVVPAMCNKRVYKLPQNSGFVKWAEPQSVNQTSSFFVHNASEEVVQQERAYFLRRHPDGQLCDGHIHDSLDEARSCSNRTELGQLWSNLAMAVAKISMRRSP
jgi:hypothetical protein